MSENYDKSKYKYIYPEPEVYNQIIEIEQVLLAVGAEINGNNLYCPNGHSKRQKIYIYKDNICKCHNCQEVKGSVVDVAKWYKGGNFRDAMIWLTETFNVQKVLNPDYINVNGETLSEEEIRTAQESIKKLQIINKIEVDNKPKEIQYMNFDESIKYRYIKDLNDFMPQNDIWGTFDNVQKLRVIYTWFYNKSFELGSNAPKYTYYKKRGIDTNNKWLKRISYLAVEDFKTVLDDALKLFPVDMLELVGLIKMDESTNEYKLSFSYVKKGGILMVPSFDLYSNTVTGFMLRPTQPEQWMIDRHMKEIQLSNTSIIFPLPFGLTYSSIKNHDTFYVTEGHPDGVALPGNVEGQEDRAFFSMPGVNGLNESHLGLLKGKKVVICFDQDSAGKKAAYGYTVIENDGKKDIFINRLDYNAKKMKTESLLLQNKNFTETNYEGLIGKLEKANIESEVKVWDTNLGSDINDVRINGNLNKIF